LCIPDDDVPFYRELVDRDLTVLVALLVLLLLPLLLLLLLLLLLPQLLWRSRAEIDSIVFCLCK